MTGGVAESTAPPVATDPVLRIGSYNIRRCIGADGRHTPERVAQVIRETGCDTIGLQEVSSIDGGPEESRQMEYLARATGLAAVPGTLISLYQGSYGSALLTSRPILTIERHDLSFSSREPRSALDVELDVAGIRTRVILTHLGLSLRERRDQVKRIIGLVTEKTRREPVILLGDINEWIPRGRPLRWLHREFGEPPAPRSFPARFPIFALDRIWVRPRGALRSVSVHKSKVARIASDHLPLTAVVEPWRGMPDGVPPKLVEEPTAGTTG